MAAQPIPALLTSDEFLDLYSRDGDDDLHRFELFNGEVVERPMANPTHEYVKNILGSRQNDFFKSNPGHMALVETTFKLSPVLTFRPDVAVVGRERFAAPQPFTDGSPDIAFEVVSSDRADRLQFKIDGYLRNGSRAVCCVFPAQKRITVYTPGQWCEYSDSANLEFLSILPGFSAPLSSIFEYC